MVFKLIVCLVTLTLILCFNNYLNKMFLCANKLFTCSYSTSYSPAAMLLFKGFFIWQAHITWSKVTIKTFIMLQIIFISSKYWSFEHSFHHSWKENTKLFNCDIRKNISWAPNRHIRMISEESCDTEDWSKQLRYFQLEYILTVFILIILHIIADALYFNLRNAALVIIRCFLPKTLPTPDFWMVAYI